MTDETKPLSSIFPDYPREQPAIDKNGNLNPLFDLGLGTLFQALQDNYRNEGIRIPVLSLDNMNIIQGLYTTYIGGSYNALTMAQPDISGQTVFCPDTYFMNQFVIAQDFASPTSRVTMAQWNPLAVMLTNAGDPNGAVAGNLNYLCYDTSGMALYVCTTAGSAAGAGGTMQAVWMGL